MFIFSPEPILLAIERRDESCKFPPPPLRGDPNKVTPSESVRKLATRIVKLQNSVTGPLRILLVGPCSTVGVGSQKEEEPFYCRHGSLSYPPPFPPPSPPLHLRSTCLWVLVHLRSISSFPLPKMAVRIGCIFRRDWRL